MSAHRVAIVGGGFGGLQAALGLRHAPVEVTLIGRRNFPLLRPPFYQVATRGRGARLITSRANPDAAGRPAAHPEPSITLPMPPSEASRLSAP